MDKNKHRISILIILVLVGVSYGNAIFNGFVFDDNKLIVQNDFIKEIKNLPKVFSRGLWSGTEYEALPYYRPMVLLTFMGDHLLFHLNPAGYHLTNILLHLLTSILVYGLAIRISGSWRTAALAAGLFAVHPLHTDAVTAISGRGDLLAALFLFLSLLFAMDYLEEHPDRAIPSRRKFLVSGFVASCFLALFSKEASIILPLVLLSYLLARRLKDGRTPGGPGSFQRRLSFLFVLSCAIAFLYLLLRSWLFGQVFPSAHVSFLDNPLVAEPFPILVLNFFQLFYSYVKLLVWPLHLSADYSFESFRVLHSLNLMAGMGIVLFVAMMAAFLMWRKRIEVAFSILFFIAAILLTSHILFVAGAILAERYLYIPSFGFCLLLGSLAHSLAISKIFKRNLLYRSLLFLVITGVFVSCSFLTIQRNRDWKDDLALFSSAEAVVPENVKMLTNLSFYLSQEGRFEAAEQKLKKAIEIYPSFADAHVNLGNILMQTGRWESAGEEYKKAILLNPDDALAHYNLGNIFLSRGDYPKALEEYRQALRIRPAYEKAHLALEFTLQKMKDPEM